MVASKETALEFEKREVQLLLLLALVSVFERTYTACRGFVGAAAFKSDQRYDVLREAMRTHTFPSGLLLAGGERGACSS